MMLQAAVPPEVADEPVVPITVVVLVITLGAVVVLVLGEALAVKVERRAPAELPFAPAAVVVLNALDPLAALLERLSAPFPGCVTGEALQ
jgi:hypothetical protein